MSPVLELGLVSRTATGKRASVWTQESFEHDCPPGDRSPVVDNNWRFDNLCGSHLQSHLQNLPKTAIAPPQQFLPWSLLREQNPSCAGADPGFFWGGGALVSCSTSAPINHIVFFFLQNTSCIRKPQVISWRGAHPLHPPPRSAPGVYIGFYTSNIGLQRLSAGSNRLQLQSVPANFFLTRHPLWITI